MRYLLLLCLMVSCAPRQSEISGEVYIITKGRETVRLSGSAVYVMDHFDAANHLAQNEGADAFEILKGMPAPLHDTTTDASGTFRLTVPPGKYVVVVVEHRAVFGTTEHYQWIVPVDATEPAKVVLNNSNLLE